MTDQPIEGTVVDVPEDEAEEAGAELARVEEAGLLPARAEGAEPVSYREAIELGHVLAASGYFSDATGAAQAAVKVMVGAELGFSPMAAIMGVHIVEGRPMISGRLLGAVVKRQPGFDFKVEWPEEVERASNGAPTKGTCRVTIIEGDQEHPPSEFSIDDATRAGLLKTDKPKSNWMAYPRKMLYWRALSWAVDFYCPQLLGGVPLVAEEDREDDRPTLMHELNPPAVRPPALATDEAEALRARARAAFDRLRAVNPTLVPPGKFANRIKNAEHSIATLTNEAEAFEAIADTEEGIAEAIATMRGWVDDERIGEADVDIVIDDAMSKATRAEIRTALDEGIATLKAEDNAEGEAS